jgi:hypothetical protein
MTSPALVRSADHTGKRIRASKSAIMAAIDAMQARGLAVGKVCISGGKVEIIPANVDDAPDAEKTGGLKDW